MQFRNFAENLFGSKIKIKLLRRLLSDEGIVSEREMAKLIGASPGAVNTILKDFHTMNLISPLRVGKSTVWQLNKESYAYTFTQNFKEKFSSSPLSELKTDLLAWIFPYRTSSHKIANPIFNIQKMIIFGSIANGSDLASSDIDLFILVASEADREEALRNITKLANLCISKYGNKLSPIIFTVADSKASKNKKLLEEISKGRVVFG